MPNKRHYNTSFAHWQAMQTAKKFGIAKTRKGCYNSFRIGAYAGVMELVDVVDSKSTASDGVPVRVRPPAP